MLSSLFLSPRQAALALILGAVAAATGFIWGAPEARIAGTALAFALAWATVVDIDRMILPDLITLPLVVAGLALAGIAGAQPLLDSAIGAAAGYLALGGVAFLYRRVRNRDGLGMGDAKLLAAAGAWLGWQALPLVMLAGSLAGLAVILMMAVRAGKIDGAQAFAFGPFIALGFWLMWLFPNLVPVFVY